MSTSDTPQRKISPLPRAFLAGFIAGILAGYVTYLILQSVIGFVIGFIVGALVGSRTVLSMARSKEEAQ